ncbi:MAG: alkaline phosphatase D family protein [Pirellulaceae bacterium]
MTDLSSHRTVGAVFSFACLAALLAFVGAGTAQADEFHGGWPNEVTRTWPGPDYWSNPLQDWRISDGRLECIRNGKDRNVHALTCQLIDREGGFRTEVTAGLPQTGGWAGFRVGIKGAIDDYRDSVFRGQGVNAGLTTGGKLFIGKPGDGKGNVSAKEVKLRLSARPTGNGYRLELKALDPSDGSELAGVTRKNVKAGQLVGNLALVAQQAKAWFADWNISGDRVEVNKDHQFGPILFSQYTLSRDIMKMTAQMPPVGDDESRPVRLQIRKDENHDWRTIDTAKIDPTARTATFRVEQWDSSRNTPYRLAYSLTIADGAKKTFYWRGTVRHDPVEKDPLVVAGFTGNKDYAFPDTDVVENVRSQNPDLLFFSGDQIYEDVAGYGAARKGAFDLQTLDYLRKWYLLGWAWGDLMRDRPTVCVPDDHDVYQGNLWGAGGRDAETMDEHDNGGYFMPPEWVNMVERTQTSHLPDPYDPTPVKQGIGVYYTSMNYGRASFAIIEDRKFKGGPDGTVPPTNSGRPDHIVDPDYDPKTVDVPGATLLGERQLEFLRDWVTDWRGADMKMLLSQTIFSAVPTHHGGNLRYLVADLDSNSWPQSARNKALRIIRKGFAFHLAGDQHLPLIVHYGADTWDDAPLAFCVPSIAAGYPRAFQPKKPAGGLEPGMPEYTGRYRDGLGNFMTIWAVANPDAAPEPKTDIPGPVATAHRKSSGHGIVRIHKASRKFAIECWPVICDTGDDSTQFNGWPRTFEMMQNYGRTPPAYLPTIKVTGMKDPVVQVFKEDGELVYALRIKGRSFRPPVFEEGNYTVKIGDQEAGRMNTLKNVPSLEKGRRATTRVSF